MMHHQQGYTHQKFDINLPKVISSSEHQLLSHHPDSPMSRLFFIQCLILVCISMLAGISNAFAPNVFTSSRAAPLHKQDVAFERSNHNHPTSVIALMAGPAVLDKPATKEEKKVSKDSEKESSSSKSKGWAVRLYNDPMNKREFVARCLTEITSLSDGAAYTCMMQAHQFGIAVVGTYHLEMAEMYRNQLTEEGLLIDMVEVEDE